MTVGSPPRQPTAPNGRHDSADALWNADLAPTTAQQRTLRWYHFAALWVGMIVAVPTWMLASGLIEQGMSAAQAAWTVLLGNLIILAPMLLIALVLGIAPNLPGFLAVVAPGVFGSVGALWTGIYTYAWFVGVAVSLVTYTLLMKARRADHGVAVGLN